MKTMLNLLLENFMKMFDDKVRCCQYGEFGLSPAIWVVDDSTLMFGISVLFPGGASYQNEISMLGPATAAERQVRVQATDGTLYFTFNVKNIQRLRAEQTEIVEFDKRQWDDIIDVMFYFILSGTMPETGT